MELETYYREMYKELLYKAKGLSPDKSIHLAEEGVQTTFERALRYCKYLSEVGSERFDGWMYTTLKNVMFDIRNKEKARGITHVADSVVTVMPISEGVSSSTSLLSLIEEVKSYIKDMPDGDKKRVMYLFFFEGLTSKDVAYIVNLSHSAVRKTLSRECALIREG